MKKKRAITHFIVSSIIVLLGLILTIFQFNIPGTYYTYNGFIKALNLGMDINGGYLAVYNVHGKNDELLLDSNVNSSIEMLTKYLKEQGHNEAVVVKQEAGNDVKIRIEISKASPDVSNILKLFGEPKNLEIKKEQSESAEAYLTGENIKSAQAMRQLGTNGYIYGVNIEFDEEGTRIFKDLTTELSENSGSLYLYLGGEYYSSAQVSNPIKDGKTFISGGMSSLEDAQEYATKIISGTLDVALTLDSNDEVTSVYSKNITTLLLIISAVLIALVFALLIIYYKELGLVSSLSLIIFSILLLFFMQAIPTLVVTIEGFIATLMAFVFAGVSHLIMLEKMKEEYKLGKKIAASVKSGVKKASITILDISAVSFISCVVLYILGNVGLKSFAFVLGIGILVNLFSTLLISRVFFNWYVNINSKNAKKINFKREATTDEIE